MISEEVILKWEMKCRHHSCLSRGQPGSVVWGPAGDIYQPSDCQVTAESVMGTTQQVFKNKEGLRPQAPCQGGKGCASWLQLSAEIKKMCLKTSETAVGGLVNASPGQMTLFLVVVENQECGHLYRDLWTWLVR